MDANGIAIKWDIIYIKVQMINKAIYNPLICMKSACMSNEVKKIQEKALPQKSNFAILFGRAV